ncbi:MAG: (d)CMP kinase [Gammaproteobacteria bacterium]|nr:(d)CMP kinase [Gammaproteobacteria bacterium]
MNHPPVITIDGPSGVGKGTMATMLANTLGWHFLDSGALYRLLALKITLVGCSGPRLLESATLVHDAKNLSIYFQNHRCYLDGQDVTEAIRQEEVGLLASQISAIPEVRQALLERQRAFAQVPGLVTDGRDMGSVVFPNADVKFYLDASPEIRAQRRVQQLKASGISVKFGDLLEDMQKRDRQDKSRLVAPLVVPKGAIEIDTGLLSKEQVFEKILSEVKSRLRSNGGV